MKSNKTQVWELRALQALYDRPLMALISQAHLVHVGHHPAGEVQMSYLISIKTGGCPEDCKYCAQSSRYQTDVSALPLMPLAEVLERAKSAISQGATRICMGAAWRQVRDDSQFERVLQMIKAVAELDVEVCCTLGMLQEHQARRLKEAGLYSYNHNLDTSAEYYESIITTRTYQDRLNTLDIAAKAGLSLCCGGIIGMGESITDRLEMLRTMSCLDPMPESVPINRLTAVPGTPLENQAPVSFWETLRLVAVARIAMPRSMVRLSAGRLGLSFQEQALCFMAGANSIHIGEKLLTVGNMTPTDDAAMFQLLGLSKRPSSCQKVAS